MSPAPPGRSAKKYAAAESSGAGRAEGDSSAGDRSGSCVRRSGEAATSRSQAWSGAAAVAETSPSGSTPLPASGRRGSTARRASLTGLLPNIALRGSTSGSGALVSKIAGTFSTMGRAMQPTRPRRHTLTKRRPAITSKSSTDELAKLQATSGAPTDPATLKLLKEALSKSPLFASLADRDPLALINKILGTLRCRKVAAGEVVIEQGTAGSLFYIVEIGRFQAWVSAVKTKPVATYGPGSSFGELALMYSGPRAATIICKAEGVLWALPGTIFRTLISNSHNDDKHGLDMVLLGVRRSACVSRAHLGAHVWHVACRRHGFAYRKHARGCLGLSERARTSTLRVEYGALSSTSESRALVCCDCALCCVSACRPHDNLRSRAVRVRAPCACRAHAVRVGR